MIHGIFCNKFYESINFSASNLKNHDLDLVQWMEAQIWNGGSIKVGKRQEEEVNCLVEVVAKVTAECCQDSLLDTTATFPIIAGVLPGILEFQGRAELTKKHIVSVSFSRYFYDGGPDLTSTILSQCWRLIYINCLQDRDHPCCGLTNRSDRLANNVIDRWLRRYWVRRSIDRR